MTSVSIVAAVVDDTATNTVTEDNSGAPRMSTDRVLLSAITDDTGARATFTGTSLDINCTGGCGASATFADNAAFTFGTTPIANAGYVVDDTATNAVTENSAGAPRMTGQRIPYADLSKSASNTNSFKVDFGGAAQPVTGPLTDTELRATPVPVSGTVTAVGPLTDAELRATPVPVSGTFFQATQPVSGTFFQATQPISAVGLPLPTGAATEATLAALTPLTDTQLRATPVPVSGPLTDVQLRATPVPVSGTVTTTPPANASTNVAQFGGNAVVTGIGASGVGIPRVTVANDSVVGVSGSVAVTGPLTDAELRATAVPVSGPLTDAQLRATAVPVSGTVTVTDGAGALNVIVDSGTVTANAGTNLNTSLLALESGGNLATLAGVVTAARAAVNPISGQAGVQGGSGIVTALTQRVVLATDVGLPAGTNALGSVNTKTALTFNAPAAASVGVASAQALASNVNRKGAVFVNTSVNTISCAVGATAVLNAGVTLIAGAAWNMNEYSFGTGAVNCIASAAASNLSIQELQ
jgi:hypothetical protein